MRTKQLKLNSGYSKDSKRFNSISLNILKMKKHIKQSIKQWDRPNTQSSYRINRHKEHEPSTPRKLK